MTYLKMIELRKMAVGSGIKFYEKLSREELTKKLKLDEKKVCKPSNAKPVWVEDEDNDCLIWCKSQYACGKLLNKDVPLIKHYIKTGKTLINHDGNRLKLSFA